MLDASLARSVAAIDYFFHQIDAFTTIKNRA
jgi:hypothetical protein